MLWQKGRSSDNVEGASGGGGGPHIGGIHLGLGGTIIAIIIAMIFPSTRGIIFGLLTGSGGTTGAGNTPAQTVQVDKSDPQVQFVSKILGSTEDVWTATFQQMGKQYVDPKLVLFHGQVST
ncbi:MAG TPA: neutral zinc metallopeptidase, partial [Rhodanobacteraceae bacterium]